MNYYLVKSEPQTFSWDGFVKVAITVWDGVRNYAARKHIRSMRTGDLVLFYHSGDEKSVMGICKVVKEAYQDPTTKEDWTAVDLKVESPLKHPVQLSAIRAKQELANIYLVRQGRLSVMPLQKAEFDLIVKMGS